MEISLFKCQMILVLGTLLTEGLGWKKKISVILFVCLFVFKIQKMKILSTIMSDQEVILKLTGSGEEISKSIKACEMRL